MKMSLFNHSCRFNCHQMFVGDYIVMATTREVKKGEELCFSYDQEDTMPYSKRLTHSSEVPCQCERCHLTRQTPGLAEIESENYVTHRRSTRRNIINDCYYSELVSKMRELPCILQVGFFPLLMAYALDAMQKGCALNFTEAQQSIEELISRRVDAGVDCALFATNSYYYTRMVYFRVLLVQQRLKEAKEVLRDLVSCVRVKGSATKATLLPHVVSFNGSDSKPMIDLLATDL
ncbi:hypothetical protein P9112_010546 [Eukaryota sp. TZLM1-RC]